MNGWILFLDDCAVAEVEEVEEVFTDTLDYLVNLSEECIDQMGQCQVDYSKVSSLPGNTVHAPKDYQ